MQCKTINYAAKGRVDVISVEVGEPKDWEVQIEALACGVCAWDVHVFKNGTDWATCPGHEGVGRVVKAGKWVTKAKVGDWVTAPGMGFTEFTNVSQDALYHIPSNKGRPEHWIVEPASCVITGLDHCAVKAGDRIALLGCGYMGLMLIQLLSHCPLDVLVAIDVDDRRLAMARQFGATETINAKDANIAELQKYRFDTVVDASGNQHGLNLSSQIVRPGGRLNLFGWNHGTATFPGDTWHLNGITVINSAPGSAIRDPWPVAIKLMERGLIDQRPLISHIVPIEDYQNLLAKAAAKEDNYIKGVVTLGSMTAAERILAAQGVLGVGRQQVDIQLNTGAIARVAVESAVG